MTMQKEKARGARRFAEWVEPKKRAMLKSNWVMTAKK
jgi:hypothetical protein